jgi:Sec7-like guanine-nucleotide exchange factor
LTLQRKLLAKVRLPKEAQQIDRAMEDFAARYFECNPTLIDKPGKKRKKK